MGGRLLTALAVAGLLAPAAAQSGRPLVVKAGRLHLGTGEVIEGGSVVIVDGRIAAVGRDVPIPDDAERLEAAVVLPGLLDAHTTMSPGPADAEWSIAPDVRVADGLDLYGDHARALAGGVTTIYVAPGERRLVAGVGCVAKTHGAPGTRLLRARAALEVRLGEGPKWPPGLFDPPLPPSAHRPLPPETTQLPGSRMGEMAALRWLLAPEGPPAELGAPAREIVAAVSRGELPVRVTARTAADGARALDLAERHGLKLVLVDLPDALRLLDRLAARKIPVVLSGLVHPGDPPPDRTPGPRDEQGPLDPATAARLAAAGVPLAIHSTRESDTGALLALAGAAVRAGLPPDAALRAITLGAAEICGVADQVGSLAPGKQGDLVLLDGDPFAAGTRVLRTIVDGTVAWQRPADAAVAAAPEGKTLVLRAARFLTVGAGEVRDGALVARNGKIVSVGTGLAVPSGAEVLDFGDATVVPGWLDAASALGLRGPGGRPARGDPGILAGSLARADDEARLTALRAGVTAVALLPDQGGGATAVVKLAGEARVVREPAGLLHLLSGGGAATRAGLPEFLKRVRDYDQEWDRWERFLAANGGKAPPPPKPPEPGKPPPPEQPKEPRKDPGMDAWRAVLRGELPLLLRPDGPATLRVAREVLAEEKRPLGLTWVAPPLPMGLADLAGGRGVLLLPPLAAPGADGRLVSLPALLAGAGVPFALGTAAAEGTRDLPLLAIEAVRGGCPPDVALRAVTLDAARCFGVDHRLGTLERGRDCDCVVLSGEPFAPTTRVLAVLVDGAVAWRAPK